MCKPLGLRVSGGRVLHLHELPLHKVSQDLRDDSVNVRVAYPREKQWGDGQDAVSNQNCLHVNEVKFEQIWLEMTGFNFSELFEETRCSMSSEFHTRLSPSRESQGLLRIFCRVSNDSCISGWWFELWRTASAKNASALWLSGETTLETRQKTDLLKNITSSPRTFNESCSSTFFWPHNLLSVGRPRRTSDSSMTSSWISDAVCIISAIMATSLWSLLIPLEKKSQT